MNSLDQFFGTTAVEQRCSNPKCRKILGGKEAIYTLRTKNQDSSLPYCGECARALLPKSQKQITETEEQP
jgi:hypothetical protein